MPTIFTKIINKEIPADIVYESEDVLAFRDINPKAPAHILIIPKIEIPTFKELNSREHGELIGKLVDTVNEVAKKEGLDKDGFRVVINCGNNGGQEVYHLHLHLLGGRQMNWPPG